MIIKKTIKPGYPRCRHCGGKAVLCECSDGWYVDCENAGDGGYHSGTSYYYTDGEAISEWVYRTKGQEC